MTLSILIPTIRSREKMFNELFDELSEQINQCKADCTILSICDNKEISVGLKRQRLLEMAKSDYIVYFDDDDWPSGDYVSQIMEALKSKPDSVGFEIVCSGCAGVRASASNRFPDWLDNFDGYDYVRTPYQKTPIKREIALKIGYKDMRFGEDYDYSKRLKQSGLIKTEVYVPEVLYYYRYKYEDHNKKYGIK